jgi:hypothetical protein
MPNPPDHHPPVPAFDLREQLALIDNIKSIVRPASPRANLRLIKGGRDG